MRVAVQAVPFVLALVLLAALLGVLISAALAIPPLIALLFVLFFFRDPKRRSPSGEGLVLSPADGRVSAIDRGDAGARVSIFLSLFDCHINRAPVAGRIRGARYTPGRYHPAWQRRASSENERNHLTIESAGRVYGVTQVAGILARRIVCTKGSGDEVTRGEKIGLIQFGSRTDLHLPPDVHPLVAVGDRVSGGVTVIARQRGSGVGASGEKDP
jgi:phosphatidylserine decarboxylase